MERERRLLYGRTAYRKMGPKPVDGPKRRLPRLNFHESKRGEEGKLDVGARILIVFRHSVPRATGLAVIRYEYVKLEADLPVKKYDSSRVNTPSNPHQSRSTQSTKSGNSMR